MGVQLDSSPAMSASNSITASGTYLDMSKSGSKAYTKTGASGLTGLKSKTGTAAPSKTGTRAPSKTGTRAPTRTGSYLPSRTGVSKMTGKSKTGKTGYTKTGVSTRIPTDAFATRKSSKMQSRAPVSAGKTETRSVEPSRSGYTRPGYSRTATYTRTGKKYTMPKSRGKSPSKASKSYTEFSRTANTRLTVPGKSGYRSRTQRSEFRTQTGAREQTMRSASGWVPTGNMIEIDEGELAELERMIMALTERAEEAEARVAQLHQITIRDVLQFIIKNSNTASVTIGDEVCPLGYQSGYQG